MRTSSVDLQESSLSCDRSYHATITMTNLSALTVFNSPLLVSSRGFCVSESAKGVVIHRLSFCYGEAPQSTD